MGTYTIKPGDTLSKIAKDMGTTVSALAASNGIKDVNKIIAGNTLTIPGANAAPSSPVVPNSNTTATNTEGTVGTGFNYKDFTYDDFNYDKDFSYDGFSYDDYAESDAVKSAGAALDSHNANKPGEYQSQWQAQLDGIMNQILNRGKFSYNFNEDALYQQYKDKYIQQGKMAMADTMGQAAAMTGGYGNSYAASVGNQAYQQSLQQLNDVIPELYQMAYDRYVQEGQDMYNQYGMLSDRENAEYGRYRDSVNDWQAERDYLTGRYDNERSLDYSKYTDDRNFQYDKYSNDRNFAYGQHVDDRNFAYNQYADDRNFAYGQYADDKAYAYNNYRDSIEDQQWQATFDEGVRQYNEQFDYQKDRDAVADSQWQAEMDRLLANDQISQEQWQAEMDRALANDKISQEQWQAAMDYQKERDKVSDSQWQAERNDKQQEIIRTTQKDTSGNKDKGNDDVAAESASDYADWSATDWQSYFAQIRSSDGSSAANYELMRMQSAGLIPKNMIAYAANGARGGSLGH